MGLPLFFSDKIEATTLGGMFVNVLQEYVFIHTHYILTHAANKLKAPSDCLTLAEYCILQPRPAVDAGSTSGKRGQNMQ